MWYYFNAAVTHFIIYLCTSLKNSMGYYCHGNILIWMVTPYFYCLIWKLNSCIIFRQILKKISLSKVRGVISFTKGLLIRGCKIATYWFFLVPNPYFNLHWIYPGTMWSQRWILLKLFGTLGPTSALLKAHLSPSYKNLFYIYFGVTVVTPWCGMW